MKLQFQDSLLSKISSPLDLKSMDSGDFARLAAEIRHVIVSTVAKNGGHLASNLGVVELSIALHRVFNSPQDKIIWDVGHQCYAHKLLTGRLAVFHRLRQAAGMAGFPKRSESPHDPFNTGHASTSISAALGILAGEKLLGGKGRVVAVIGDGALTGGLAYEALSHAGHLNLPLIVILNDNKMSISPNVGALSKYLSRLTMKSNYQTFRRHFDGMVIRLPVFGEIFLKVIRRLKRAVKAVFYKDNFFVDLGFDYVGPIDGHNTRTLLSVLEDVQKLDRPVVVHVVTRKGKGYGFAENDPGSYHGVNSFSVDDGIEKAAVSEGGQPSFTGAFGSALLDAARDDGRLVAITAAMDKGTGLSRFKRAFPGRFFDVGIAEEHALTFAAGLAAQGLKPVVAVYSTFIQRSVDQIIHDAALQKLPVILALDRGGFVGDDGETHQGLFDISLFRSTPNMTILAPAGEGELRLMLDWALKHEGGPVIIRYPKALCPVEIPVFSLPLESGRGLWIAGGAGGQICLAFTGSLYREVLEAADLLWKQGIEADIYNLRFLKPVDEDYLEGLMNSYALFAVIEEGIREGGFGEYAAALAMRRGCAAKIETLAVAGDFAEKINALGTREQLLAVNGLDGAGIAGQVAASYMESFGAPRGLGHDKRINDTNLGNIHTKAQRHEGTKVRIELR
ncbi:MAG: 1-deoxy-D-xylulose-5-phosphate synthase [Spirochaetes bacterium]|nr:1-deoxy-D-xylulose-5-phosphate synthase [Spirochaetota bacterium]